MVEMRALKQRYFTILQAKFRGSFFCLARRKVLDILAEQRAWTVGMFSKSSPADRGGPASCTKSGGRFSALAGILLLS